MVLDDNAQFRHADLAALRDEDEIDPAELEAQRYNLNYVHLDGNIGVMVNGAGLALATVDLLKEQGGEPADFMDVRPEATRAQITHGFKLLLRNPAVRSEEHTSELQSLMRISYAVFCLKKKKTHKTS